MKVAHVLSTFWPKIGGMGEVCRQEVEYLTRAGVETSVFTLRYPNLPAAEKLSYSISRLQPLVKLGDGGLVPQLSGQLKKYDLVHLHYPFYGGAEWVWWNKIRFGRPYLVTYHMDASPHRPAAKAVKFIYDHVFVKRILGGAKKIIALDLEHFQQTDFGHTVPRDHVVELANGVDAKVFHTTGANWDSLGLKQLSGKQVVLFVGNFMPVKRFDLILSALRLLSPKVFLVAVGGGYEFSRYRDLTSKLDLQDRVFFAGPITDQNKLADFYSAADCLVVASDKESFSLATLESLACGTPVVASDVPGARGRVVDDVRAGFIFAAGDELDLADKLKQLFALSPEQQREMGRNGRDKILKNYTWEKHGEKLLSIYREIL